jgi:hypothetical protein
MCASDADFRDSTAAARANAWLGGQGSAEAFRSLLPSLGLSDAGQTALLQR